MTTATARSSRPQWIVAGLFLVLAVTYDAFIVTHGLFRFVGREPMSKLYIALWQSVAEGHLDMDPAQFPREVFWRDGKAYTYYGIFPALLRGLLLPFAGPTGRGLSQVSCTLAGGLSAGSFITAAGLLTARSPDRRVWFLVYLGTVTFAMPLLICLGLATVYNEAVLWGCAWASVFQAALVAFAVSPSGSAVRARALVLMGVAAGLTLHSRVTLGFCVCGEFLGLLVWSAIVGRLRDAPQAVSGRARWGAVLILSCFVALQGAVNYGRWGNAFEFRPLRLHEEFHDTERGRRAAQEGEFALNRVPSSACFYFLPGLDSFQSTWPFLATGGRSCFPPDFPFDRIVEFKWQYNGEWFPAGVEPYYDLIEGPRMPLVLSSPILILLAVLGCARAFRLRGTPRLAVVLTLTALVATLGVLLSINTLTSRYLADLSPFLAGLGLFVLAPAAVSRPPSRPTITLLVACLAYSVGATSISVLLDKYSRAAVPTPARENIGRILEWGRTPPP